MRHQHAKGTLAAERYLLDEMTEQERYEFEAHYFDCEECAEIVLAGAAMAAGARAGRTSRVVPVTPAPERRSRVLTFVPLAAAAALALVAGYQALVTIPGLRARVTPRAIHSVALAPASRGDAPVIPIAAAREGVTLMVDVNAGTGAGPLAFQLDGPADISRLSAAADAPAPGMPLTIWLPPNYLTAGEYQLAVQSAAQPGQEIGRYRFVVR
jgi:hypothetical protein